MAGERMQRGQETMHPDNNYASLAVYTADSMLLEGNFRNRLYGLGTVSDLLMCHLDLRATVHTANCLLGTKTSSSPARGNPGHPSDATCLPGFLATSLRPYDRRVSA